MPATPARRSPKSKPSNTVAQNCAASLLAAAPGEAYCVECDGQGDNSRPGHAATWVCERCEGRGTMPVPAGSFQRFA